MSYETIDYSLPRLAVLRSDSSMPCGVEAFARRLAASMEGRAVAAVLDRGIARRLRGLDPDDVLVVNLPVVAWKKRLVDPVRAVAAARARGQRVVVVLHEWGDLDWRRRASYVPLLLMANVVLFSCPSVARDFARSPLSKATTARRGVVPIPPNVSHPPVLAAGPHSARVALERARGRLIVGHFGSIYPKKRSLLVLDVAADLKARGEDPFVVFAGSFIRGSDAIEQEFHAHARRLGLDDRVLVTGFIATEEELFGLFEGVDVFLYSFVEGLSSRRASVFACLTSGKPVVVNAPREAGDFDHHPTYRKLLASDRVRLVRHEADVSELADAVLAARDLPPAAPGIDVAAAWMSVVKVVEAAAMRPAIVYPELANASDSGSYAAERQSRVATPQGVLP